MDWLGRNLGSWKETSKKFFKGQCNCPNAIKLAGLFIETLDPVSEPDVEAAWSEEIKRRLAEIDARAVELIPWEEVRAELFGPIATASPSQP